MRVTNQMMSNNSLRNLQTSTHRVDTLIQQLTTGQKIQRASDDPVVAVRALKLRNTVSQLNQFKTKNIKDADNWMDLTENSITSIANYIEYMSSYCVQGSTDSFNNENRSAIAETIRSYKDMIFSEGNTTYAGRYVFSGYKTDTSLVFSAKDATKYSYNITEELDHSDIDIKTVTLNAVEPEDLDLYLAGTKTYGTAAYPKQETVYRLRLGYDNLTVPVEDTTTNTYTPPLPTVSYVDGTGTTQTLNVNTVMDSTREKDYYRNLGDDEVRYLPATGELIFGKDVYSQIQNSDKISINYTKDEFKQNELRPEHYFNCIQTEKSSGKTVQFEISDRDQEIEYEVNFNQKIRVNTMGRDLITHDMGRSITELADKVAEVDDSEKRLAELKGLLTNPKYSNNSAAIEQINYMITDAENEVQMKNQEMRNLFNQHISVFQDFQTSVTALQSDSGARTAKLDMIAERVSEQYTNFYDLMSANEEVEYEEKAIAFSSAAVVYNAALQVTGNVLQKSLLDFI